MPLPLLFLIFIFNTSIRTCVFPTFSKSGSQHDIKNYRPVSLLSVVSKILERFVHRELLLKCNELNILPDSQHGFLPKRSCQSNLLTTYDYLTSHIDGGVPCDMIFLDFKKAFDSVSHTKLIDKLYVFKLPQTIISWVHSYLFARRQRVCLRGSNSSWSYITSGVPQGSVLGPLLFNIFISDLPKCIISQNCSYADDLKLFYPSFLSNTIQQDLNRIEAWTSKNGLDLNPDKCVVMHFGHGNPFHRYFICNKVIPSSTSHSDLGILVDSSLKFHQHAEYIIAKVIKKAHYILKTFLYINANLFSTLFKTFLRPVLEYSSRICRPCYPTFINRLETCQRRITKWCRPLRHLSYHDRLQRLNLTTVKSRLKRGDLILTYR